MIQISSGPRYNTNKPSRCLRTRPALTTFSDFAGVRAMTDLKDAVKIPLTRGLFALVDQEDADRVNQFKWHSITGKNGNSYALRKGPRSQRPRKSILLHNFILGISGDQEADHIDLDGLNNRRSNLRIGTHQTNCYNRRAPKGTKYGLKGVSFDKDCTIRPWSAKITACGKERYLGQFPTKSDAARACNEAATRLHGEFARLNVIEE